MQAISISTLRNNIKKYLDEVTNSFETVIISRNTTEDSVVILSLTEYNSIQETLHLLSTKNNRQRLFESIAQAEAGDFIEYKDGHVAI
jgi:antitoxin YefM